MKDIQETTTSLPSTPKKKETQMIGNILSKLGTILLITMLIFGLYTAMRQSEDPKKILKNITEEPQKKTPALACYAISFGAITPSITKEWIPPKDKKIFILEDFPLPDGTDFLFLGITVLLTFLILKVTLLNTGNNWKKWVLAILILLLVITLSWIILKIATYFSMYACGESIGLDKESIDKSREQVNQGYAKTGTLLPSVLLTIFVGLTVVKGIFTKKGGKKG